MRRLSLVTPLVVAALVGACGPPVGGPAPEPAPDPCVLAADSLDAPAGPNLTLALGAPVDPAHAPIPVNHAEALVFRQLYETLVLVDCEGAVRPGLARSWSGADDGRVWEFVLRDARFWDGRPVTAGDVAAAWATTPHAARLGVAPESVTALDDRRLRVATDRPAAEPYLFAEPALAIASPDARGSTLPAGSGRFQLTLTETPDGLVRLALVAIRGNARFAVRTIHPAAARDALDGDVDLLITDDPDAVNYAKGRADLAAIALPWDRTYVLASAQGAPITTGGDAAAFRASLARDAVRADARGAPPPFWWERLPRGCLAAEPTVPPPTAGRILHERGDAAARGLAARLVALALLERGLRVEALAAPEFPAALRSGGDHYVLSVPRRVLDACAAARDLVARAPWLAGTLESGPAQSLTPLIDVRRHVLARALPAGATVGWGGTIRFADR